MRIAVLCLGLFLGWVSGLKAHAHHDHRRCADALGKTSLPQIQLFNSGRDTDMSERQREAARIIYQDIAVRLGLAIPDMVIKSLTASDMAAMTANAGHPSPSAFDGLNVIENSARSGNILEFVETGRESHVQYLRDRNSFEETLIVFSHVVGHYDFAMTSYLFDVREGDRIRDSYELAQEMTRLSMEHDAEEVDQFYQWLLSTKQMQDLARSSFVLPEDLKRKVRSGRRKYEANMDPRDFNAASAKMERNQHPSAPTSSILQALVHNLPEDAPEYRKRIVERFERLHRVGPAIMQTKIMNEGWATLMEYIILSHSPWNDGNYILQFADINAGVNRPGFDNPYWLGVQAWMRIRERFLERPEVRDLSAFEQDKAFIAFARNEVIRKMTDYSFLRFALDAEWFEKWNLFLFRELTPEEQHQKQTDKSHIAITRQPNRLRDFIAQRYANFDWKVPQVELVDLAHNHSQEILYRHAPVGNIPLERTSLAKTLFVLSQIHERPVVIEAVGTNMWFQPELPSWYIDHLRAIGRLDLIPNTDSNETYRYRLRVTPDGEVSVEFLDDMAKIAEPQKLVEIFQAAVKAYQFDLSLSYSLSEHELSPNLKALMQQAMASGEISSPETLNLIGHAPTAAKAVFKYLQLMDRRSNEVLRLAAEGKWPIRQSRDGKNVLVRIMPEIPTFNLDWRIYSKRMKARQRTPHDPRWSDRLLSFSLSTSYEAPIESNVEKILFADEDLKIGSGRQQPGDVFSPPKGNGNGQGEGEEGDEGDEGEEGEEGEEAGEGSGNGEDDDPSLVKIPMELFGQIIAEQIELKNVRRTSGGSNPMESDRRADSANRPNGHVHEDKTFENIIEKGIAYAHSIGKNPRELSVVELYKLGLRFHDTEDIVVYDRETVMVPEMDAVIVYVADTSGSMGPEHREIERKMVAFTSAVLKTIYPHLKERFVIYDSEAKEVSRKDFFVRNLGGGTETSKGLEVVENILEDYPRERYNRYVQVFSDGGDFSTERAISMAKEMAEKLEFFAYGHVAPEPLPGEMAPLSNAFKQLAAELQDKVGYAELSRLHESLIQALRRYYGKQPN